MDKSQAPGKRFGDGDGVGLGDEIERLIKGETVAGELMIAHGEIGQQIDAVDVQPFGARAAHRQEAIDRRGDIENALGIAHQRQHRFRHAAFTVGDLEHRLAGDLLDGRLKRRGQRPIDQGDGDDDRNAQRHAQKRQ